MRFMFKAASVSLISLIIGSFLFAQNGSVQTEFKIGKPCPPLSLTGIEHYTKKTVTISDFRGKWLILDFWNQYCASCYQSFPKINQIRKDLTDHLEIVLIGMQDKENRICTLYEKFRAKHLLNIPITFDSCLFKRFNIGPCPYVVIIDDKGIVRAVTSSFTQDDLFSMMRGESPALIEATTNNEFEEQYKKTLSFLSGPIFPDKPDSNFIFCSYLERWQPGGPFSTLDYMTSKVIRAKKYIAPRSTLRSLYKVAYGDTVQIEPYPNPKINSNYGKWWPSVLLEVRDSSAFTTDLATGKNIFNYVLLVPENMATTPIVKQCLQSDLKKYFGYEASVEIREMPCWKITVTPQARVDLKSKTGTTGVELNPTGIRLQNASIRWLIQSLYSSLHSEPPFIDETGITESIDLSIDVIVDDFQDYKKALEKKGIKLAEEKKKMKVIVIRDRD